MMKKHLLFLMVFIAVTLMTTCATAATNVWLGDQIKTNSIYPTNYVQLMVQRPGTSGAGSNGLWRLIRGDQLIYSLINSTQFVTNSDGKLVIKDGAFTTNQTLFNPYLNYDGGGVGYIVQEPRNEGIWWYQDVNDFFKIDATNIQAYIPIRGIDPVATNDLVTKNYADAITGSTNQPHITVTNGINFLTNAPLKLYGTGYESGTDYSYGRFSMTSTGLNICTLRAGSSTTNNQVIYFCTDGTNRWGINQIGNFIPLGADGAYNIGSLTSPRIGAVYGNIIQSVNNMVSGAAITATTHFESQGRIQLSGGGTQYGLLQLNAANNGGAFMQTTNAWGISFGTFNAAHPFIMSSNRNLAFTHGGDPSGASATVVIDSINNTNMFRGSTTITNLTNSGPVAWTYGGRCTMIISNSTVQFDTTVTPIALSNYTRTTVSRNIGADLTAGTLQLTNAGTYMVYFNLSFETTTQPADAVAEVYLDSTATGLRFKRDMTANSASGSATISGLITATAGQLLSVKMSTTSTETMIVRCAQLTAKQEPD
jgi:hypothetical protein